MEGLFSRRNSYIRNNHHTVYKKNLNDISQLLVAIFQHYDILKSLLRTAFKKEFRHLFRYQVFEADFVMSENK
jgi:hypothetical protein